MSLYSFIIRNKFILEALYALIICLVSMLIVLKTDRIYKLSLHKGIRYFRNAFFFYGIAFAIRYIFGIFADFQLHYAFAVKMLFEYFFIMSGFFLFYSLIYKKLESSYEDYTSSLLNPKIFVFYIIAFLISVFDYFWQTYFFMFFSQIAIFFFALIISFINYKKYGRQRKFLKFYFIAMFLGLVAWTFNLLVALYFQWNPTILIDIGIINVIFFLLFLYGVIKFTQK